MDCVEAEDADIEAAEETDGCPILATGLCKSSALSRRAGRGGGWGRREDMCEESAGRLLFPTVVPLVLVLLVLLLVVPFLDGGLLGLLLLLGERSLSMAA